MKGEIILTFFGLIFSYINFRNFNNNVLLYKIKNNIEFSRFDNFYYRIYIGKIPIDFEK